MATSPETDRGQHSSSRFLQTLAGQKTDRPPVWFMRQAGRHLPEYRALRETAGDFISYCMNPEKAAEATLQPVRRFPYDAAIVFADILLIPKALGQKVWFEAGEGPRLGELPAIDTLRAAAPGVAQALSTIGETLSRVRPALEPERALIGFAGGPWTVLTYMLQTKGENREAARRYAYLNVEHVDQLLDVIVQSTADYLAMQVKAGADALQIFESWAEGLPEDQFERLVTQPHTALIAALRARGVTVPIIGFPRGAGALVEGYADRVPVNAIGLDTQAPLSLGQRLQAKGHCIQGALDPLLLHAGGPALDRRIDELIEGWSGGPHIFNLGHGILPDTPIPHVAQALSRITGKTVTGKLAGEL